MPTNVCPYCFCDTFENDSIYEIVVGKWANKCIECGKWSQYDEKTDQQSPLSTENPSSNG